MICINCGKELEGRRFKFCNRSCYDKYRNTNDKKRIEHNKRYSKEYASNNKDKIKIYNKENKEKLQEYRLRNKDKINESSRKSYYKNRDKTKEHKK